MWMGMYEHVCFLSASFYLCVAQYVCVCMYSKHTRFTGNADAIRSSNELHRLLINPHQSDGVDEG